MLVVAAKDWPIPSRNSAATESKNKLLAASPASAQTQIRMPMRCKYPFRALLRGQAKISAPIMLPRAMEENKNPTAPDRHEAPPRPRPGESTQGMDLGTGVRRTPSAPKAEQHLAEQQRGIRGSISMPIAHNPQLPSSEKSARSKLWMVFPCTVSRACCRSWPTGPE